MRKFFTTRAEQLAMARDPQRSHLARPAPGADPEFYELIAALGPPTPAREIVADWTPDLMGKLTGRIEQ